jgi:catechol 2,3-dioxygenase-like lactoylglutathione lyase family enzyme
MGTPARRVHHTGITVRDMEESIAFYRSFLGIEKTGECFLEVQDEGPLKGVRIRITFLADGELELLQYQNPVADHTNQNPPWVPGNQHVSFKVDDIHGLYEKNKDRVQFMSAPIHYQTEGIDTTWVYARDPNGAIIELSEDHGERQYKV